MNPRYTGHETWAKQQLGGFRQLLQCTTRCADDCSMVSTMKFVGATVDELLKHTHGPPSDADIATAAAEFLASLEPIGEPFDVPWKFSDSLEILRNWLPHELSDRLTKPGESPPENHVEACIVALALEAGVSLQPLSKSEMLRLQHTARYATKCSAWGRQSSYPWDTVAFADIESYDFFALSCPT